MRISWFRRPRKDSVLLKLGLVVVFLLYAVAAFLTENEVLMLGLHAMRIPLSIGVMYRFHEHWWPAFNAERIGKVDVMALSVFFWSLGTLYHASYILAWRAIDRPTAGLVASDWNGVGYVFSILAMIGMLYTQRTEENEVPKANIVYTTLVLMLGIIVGVTATAYHAELVRVFPHIKEIF